MALKSKFGVDEKKAEVDERLTLLGKQLDRLKVLYEQYFMGIQKVPPNQLHRDVERGVRELTQLKIRNTAMRYRFTTISQKFGSYNTYWRRTMRQIESGKYVRDVNRAVRRARAKGEDIPDEVLRTLPKRVQDRVRRDREALRKRQIRDGTLPAEATEGAEGPESAESAATELDEPARSRNPKPTSWQIDENAEFDMDAMFASIKDPAAEAANAAKAKAEAAAKAKVRATAAAKARAKPPAPARTARPGTKKPDGSSSGMDEKQRRALYKRYIKARKLVGERIDNVSYDKLMRTIDKQSGRIMKQHKKAKRVDFNVVIKDDKVILKAKPKG